MCCTHLAGNTRPKKSLEIQDPKNGQKFTITTLLGYVFATKARIDNRKKLVRQQYLSHTSSQYGELWPASGWDRFISLGHPSYFQRVSHLGSVTARHSSTGRQRNFAALKRGRHLYLAGRPSRWELAHILIVKWHCSMPWSVLARCWPVLLRLEQSVLSAVISLQP